MASGPQNIGRGAESVTRDIGDSSDIVEQWLVNYM
jgi:hypothetical protein